MDNKRGDVTRWGGQESRSGGGGIHEITTRLRVGRIIRVVSGGKTMRGYVILMNDHEELMIIKVSKGQ